MKINWKDGGNHGRFCREIVSENGSHAICYVWTKRNSEHRNGGIDGSGTEPYPQGEDNFRLILAAPELAHTLHELLWEMVTMSDLINREDPGMMNAIEHHEFETDHVRACQRARELLARFGMTAPPQQEALR